MGRRGDRGGRGARASPAQPQQRKKQRHHHHSQPLRQAPPPSTGPSAAFLAALEEQRENERRRQAQQQLQRQALNATPDDQTAIATDASSSMSTSSRAACQQRPKAAHITGYYYDEAQRRYFRLTPDMAQRLAREKKQLAAQQRDAAAHTVLQARRAAQQRSSSKGGSAGTQRSVQLQSSAAAPPKSWVAYLAERESSASWSARRRDRVAMVPRVFASRMVHGDLAPVHRPPALPSQGTTTALNFQAAASDVGAMGFSSGCVDVFRVGYEQDMRSGFGKQAKRRLTTVAQWRPSTAFQVSALRWQPTDALGGSSGALLSAFVGGDASSQTLHTRTGASSGFVSLRRVGESAAMQSSVQEWAFHDPWTVEWSPIETAKFAVGLGGSECAVIVDSAVHDGVDRAPRGKIKSDVMAQAFTSTGRVLVNGTRNGTAWLWDLRARRRAQEGVSARTTAAAANAEQQQHRMSAAAVLDLHVLRDDIQVVVLKSNGELSLLDVRTFRTVVTFAPGRTNAYFPRLKCAVDATETLVVATDTSHHERDVQAVNSYAISSGRLASRLCVSPATASSARTPLLEQVHLRACPADASAPEIWALGRNELFANTSGWSSKHERA